jgi:hypothetical protein
MGCSGKDRRAGKEIWQLTVRCGGAREGTRIELSGCSRADLLEPDRGAKLCATCGLDIPSVARVCTHCDAYQDWRRHLSFSSTILSLLIALFSVLTVLIPVLKDHVREKKSELAVSALNLSSREMSINEFLLLVGEQGSSSSWAPLNERFQFHRLTFVATNSGDAPAAITHLVLEGLNVASPFSGERLKQSSFRLCDQKSVCGPIVVGPRETLSFVGYGDAWTAYGPLGTLRLTVTYIETDGTVRSLATSQTGISDQRGLHPQKPAPQR